MYLFIECSGDWDMTLNYSVDFGSTSGDTEQVSLNCGSSSLWGTMIWGADPWGGGTTREKKKIVLRGAVGKSIQFKFSTNTADQYFKVHEAQVIYNLRGLR